MAHTNAWDEDVPLGTEDASTADNYLRVHRLDLGERLEDQFYGFNADSNAAPENDYGVKSLRCYKQASDPTSATDYAHIYVKLVDGVPELFYQDDENTTLQLTSGGDLKSTAGLVIDGTSTLTGAVTCASTLDVAGNIDPTTYETTNGGFLDEDDMASDAADKVASQQSIKAYIATLVGSSFHLIDIDGTAAKVYFKFFTGTLDADTQTDVAHGITGAPDKILSVNAMAYNTALTGYIAAEVYKGASAGNDFDILVDGTNVSFRGVGTNIQGQKYHVKVEYIL